MVSKGKALGTKLPEMAVIFADSQKQNRIRKEYFWTVSHLNILGIVLLSN